MLRLRSARRVFWTEFAGPRGEAKKWSGSDLNYAVYAASVGPNSQWRGAGDQAARARAPDSCVITARIMECGGVTAALIIGEMFSGDLTTAALLTTQKNMFIVGFVGVDFRQALL
ncbi:jg7921 [Pararge aegeria aegeria]|uniref:Jg7921 protein n=1 Tax=Pararge aegeria aegeria TaxID=348720 RepID=A0A8S4R7C1_9NEOP|nr:jg7921 [Pararge aegeria aegeria]